MARRLRASSRSLLFELRYNLTAYDGMYEALRLPLLTDDGKFATTPGHHAEIHHYPD